MKKALITGISGQDGSYLAELLVNKDYEVHGTVNSVKGDLKSLWRLSEVIDNVKLYYKDQESENISETIFNDILPDEVYHLASVNEINISIEGYIASRKVNIDDTALLLDAISKVKPNCRFFYASSSMIFANSLTSPQNELTEYSPNSLYGITKVAGMNLIKLYREKNNLFACTGILYNHESIRRSSNFLSKKVVLAAAKIKLGISSDLVLGDLKSKRDWGFAADYVEAMWGMLQSNNPQDYIIGTEKSHTVENLLDIAFETLDLDWHNFVSTDSKLIRPSDNFELIADISKIKKDIGWVPSTNFRDIIERMVKESLIDLSKGYL